MTSNRGFTSQDQDNPDVKAIAELARAIHETVDVEKLMDFYASDAVRIAPYAPGVYHGSDDIRESFEQSLKDVAERRVELDLNIVTNGNMAVAHGQQQVSITSTEHMVRKLSRRSHDVFKKDGDAWKVVLQHTSFLSNLQKMEGVVEQPFIKPGLLHWAEPPFPEGPIPLDQAERELNEWQIDDVHAQVAEQAMRYYGPGDYTTVYDSRTPPGRAVGMWDVYMAWLPQMMLKHVDDTLKEFRVFSDGQFASVYTIQDVVATKLDGSTLKEQIRQTDSLHRVDGHWYSYVESVSWPIDEASGKVILNLPEQQPQTNAEYRKPTAPEVAPPIPAAAAS